MPLHDTYARRTPFEIAFPDRSVLEELSSKVERESRRKAVDDSTLESFVTMASVAEVARAMRGPHAPPESTYPFAALLYHGVHFLRAGCALYLLGTGTVRRLTGSSDDPMWSEWGSVRAPSTAGYMQLPQHLMWTKGAMEGTPESLDGVFWTVSTRGMLNALPISGILPGRPGFGALPLPAAPLAEAAGWLGATVRADGGDFTSTLPGGELDELYSVEAAGEVLKVLARFFVLAASEAARLEERLGAAGPESPPSTASGVATERPERRVGDPPPSTLPYTRVSLGD